MSLQQQSAEISCKHMSELAIKERDLNHFKYITQMRSKITEPVNDRMLNSEHKIIKGYVIDKKNCIYKRPEYNSGDWEKQFNTLLLDRNNIFNIQTKNKSIYRV